MPQKGPFAGAGCATSVGAWMSGGAAPAVLVSAVGENGTLAAVGSATSNMKCEASALGATGAFDRNDCCAPRPGGSTAVADPCTLDPDDGLAWTCAGQHNWRNTVQQSQK